MNDRTTYIGASECAAVCGVSGYRTPLDVYMAKTEGDDFEGNDATWFGHQFEPVIIEAYRKKYAGHVVVYNEQQDTTLHEDYPFIGATLDAKRLPKAGDIYQGDTLVECKAFHPRRKNEFGEDGSSEVPIDCMFQCQQQMAVLGVDHCDLAVLFGVNDFHVYHIERDDRLIEQIIEIEKAFWACVQEKRPPRVDPEHKQAVASLRKYYRQIEGEPVELDSVAWEAAMDLQRHKEAKRSAEAEIDKCNAIILQAMGNAPIGELPDGSSFRRSETAETKWTEADIEKAKENLGKTKRKSCVRLTHRKAK